MFCPVALASSVCATDRGVFFQGKAILRTLVFQLHPSACLLYVIHTYRKPTSAVENLVVNSVNNFNLN